MVEKTCVQCGALFHSTVRRARCCSNRCSGARWRKENREVYNAIQRRWRKSNPEKAQALYAKRHIGLHVTDCAFCGGEFDAKRTRKKFCSVYCRNRSMRRKAAHRRNAYKTQRQWRLKNRERVNARACAHYTKYILNKLDTQPWLTLLAGAKKRAKEQNLPYNLDIDWFKKRWTGRCELTGIAFRPPKDRVGHKRKGLSPSIDKKIPSRGYVKTNCRIVLWAINSFKGDGTDAEMFTIANALLRSVKP